MTNNTGDLGAISLLSSGNSPANGLFIRTLSTNSLILGTNSTANLTIASGGAATFSSSVGIGNTATSDRLSVTGTDFQNTAYFLGGATTGASYGLQIRAGSNSTDYALQISNRAGGELFRVRGDGNVGIGTTTPTSTANYATLALNGTSGGQLEFQTAGTGRAYIYSTVTSLFFEVVKLMGFFSFCWSLIGFFFDFIINFL